MKQEVGKHIGAMKEKHAIISVGVTLTEEKENELSISKML